MPPFRRVKSLFVLSSECINRYFIDCSRHIVTYFGTYESEACQRQCSNLQRYLSNLVSPFFVDDLLRKLDSSVHLNDRQKCVLLSILMHPGMKVIAPEFHLPVVDDFYLNHLVGMNKLVFLNLSMVCTDEILQVVGDNCPNLETIRILSKVESARSLLPDGFHGFRFNALRLNFFISDDGLEHLHKCTRLREITMNKLIRSNCGGRKVSHEGIKNLLINLKRLEYINYKDMGLVLDQLDPNCTLTLNRLQDIHITPERFSRFEKLCPKLSDLALFVPLINAEVSKDCLLELSKSSINLKSLELMFFDFGEAMETFLTVKGEYLTSLSVCHREHTSVEALLMVGKLCPNLKTLQINAIEKEARINPEELTHAKYFTNLEQFILTGIAWEASVVLPLCIYNATGLRMLSLLNNKNQRCIDNDIKLLMAKNPLAKLESACLLFGNFSNFDLLDWFILSCKNLKSLKLRDNDRIQEYVNQFTLAHSYLDFDITLSK